MDHTGASEAKVTGDASLPPVPPSASIIRPPTSASVGLPATPSIVGSASPSFKLTALSPRLQGVIGGPAAPLPPAFDLGSSPGALPASATASVHTPLPGRDAIIPVSSSMPGPAGIPSAVAASGTPVRASAGMTLVTGSASSTPGLSATATSSAAAAAAAGAGTGAGLLPGAASASTSAAPAQSPLADDDVLSRWVRENGGTRALRRILICNNGIAAVKAIRSMRQWCYQVFGNDKVLHFVAMATPEDLRANAEYIHLADEFVPVPGGANNNNYANIHLITEIAETTKCDAVWAGWGHASENPKLPDLLAQTATKVAWIGPPSHAMRALGDKIGSTLIAQSAGVPCMPWSGDGLTVDYARTGIPDKLYSASCINTADEALVHATRIGFPVMIKASEGGGGKGIRRVESAAEVPAAFRQVQGEVPGSPVFVMKLAGKCRHLEVQLLCDAWGDAIAIFGRDCSIQRRHQKIIEEGPVVAAPPDVWRRMEQSAVRLAKEVNYVGAGTVEYLYMDDGSYSFLELNPRLQVEHPVTELISGVNLPAAQLQVAMGIPLQRMPGVRKMFGELPDSSTRIDFENTRASTLPGHVIACRITAENPDDKFQPTSGVIQELHFRSTPDVWGYFSVGPNGLVHEFADSQFGHLFAVGATRDQARQAMVQALKELEIRGDIRTTIEYLRVILEADDYKNNKISTTWLEGVMARSSIASQRPDKPLAVLCGALFRAHAQLQSREAEYQAVLARGQLPSAKTCAALVRSDVELIYDDVKYSLTVTKSSPTTYDLAINTTVSPSASSGTSSSAGSTSASAAAAAGGLLSPAAAGGMGASPDASPSAGAAPAPATGGANGLRPQSLTTAATGPVAAEGSSSAAAATSTAPVTRSDLIATADIHNLSDGGFLVLLNGRKHVMYGREFPSGLRLTIDACTCLFSQEYDPTQVRAQMQGKLVQWLVDSQTHVDKGQPIAEVEVMKMYVSIAAPEAGILTTIKPPGSVTEVGDLIATLALDDPACVKKAEAFSGPFPTSAATEVDAEIAAAVKTHARLRRAEHRLRMLLSGYHLSSKQLSATIAEAARCVTDPMLPALQYRELASNMAGRLPQPLLETGAALVDGYVAAVTTAAAGAAPETAEEAAGELVFPAAQLEALMLAFTDPAASAAAAAEGRPSAATTAAASNLTATRSALEASGLWDLVKQYKAGNLAYARGLLKGLVTEYLSVEELFLVSGTNTGTGTAVPLPAEDIIHALRKTHKDNVARVAAIARAHHALAPRTALVQQLLTLAAARFPTLFRDQEWLSLLRRLAALSSTAASGLVLQARQALMRLRLPALSVRMAAIEAALRRAIESEKGAADASDSTAVRVAAHSAALAPLVDQSQPIEDVILRFVTHPSREVSSLALEVAIRRAFKLFTIPAFAIVSGAAAVAQSKALQDRAAFASELPVRHTMLAKWLFHMDYKSGDEESLVLAAQASGSRRGSPQLGPASSAEAAAAAALAAAAVGSGAGAGAGAGAGGSGDAATLSLALPSTRGKGVVVPASTPSVFNTGSNGVARSASTAGAAAGGVSAGSAGASSGRGMVPTRFMRIDSLAALQGRAGSGAMSPMGGDEDGDTATALPHIGGTAADSSASAAAAGSAGAAAGGAAGTPLGRSSRYAGVISPQSIVEGYEAGASGDFASDDEGHEHKLRAAASSSGRDDDDDDDEDDTSAEFGVDVVAADSAAAAAAGNRTLLRRLGVMAHFATFTDLKEGFPALAAEFENAPRNLGCARVLRRVPVHVLYVYVSGGTAEILASAAADATAAAAASGAATSPASAPGSDDADAGFGADTERDAAVSAALKGLVDEHCTALAQYRVRRVTFILATGAAADAAAAADGSSSPAADAAAAGSAGAGAGAGAGTLRKGADFPLYFTFRQTATVGEFCEDTSTRHIEPNQALHMQLYRLDAYDYDLVPTTNRMVHLFAAVPKTVTAKLAAAAAAAAASGGKGGAPKPSRPAYDGRRFFARVLVRRLDSAQAHRIINDIADDSDSDSMAALPMPALETTPAQRPRSLSRAPTPGSGSSGGDAHPETEVAFVEALNSLEIAMAKATSLAHTRPAGSSAPGAGAGAAAAAGKGGRQSVLYTPGGNGKWLFNHVFVNVLVDVLVDSPANSSSGNGASTAAAASAHPASRININYVDSIIRSLTRRYADKIRRLHITHVEFALTVRLRNPSGPALSLPCRFVCENPTGYVLRVGAYYERLDPVTGRVLLVPFSRPPAPSPVPGGGLVATGLALSPPASGVWALSTTAAAAAAHSANAAASATTAATTAAAAAAAAAAPTITATAVPVASAAGGAVGGASCAGEEYLDADAPYATSFPYQRQRLTAASMDTVWCYDFIPLLDKTVRRAWRSHLLQLLASAAALAAAVGPEDGGAASPLSAADAAAAAAALGLDAEDPAAAGFVSGDLPTLSLLRLLFVSLAPQTESPVPGRAAAPPGPTDLVAALHVLKQAPLDHFRAAGRALLGAALPAEDPAAAAAAKALRAAVLRLPQATQGVIAEFAHVAARIPTQFVATKELILEPVAGADVPGSAAAAAAAAAYSGGFALKEVDREPGRNNIGMVAWRVTLRTPECLSFPLSVEPAGDATALDLDAAASGRELVLIANDITHLAGSFGPSEDILFDLASKHARALRLPRVYLAANSGARIGLADELRGRYKVGWVAPTGADSTPRSFEYIYLEPADYEELKGSVKCHKVTVDGADRWVITDIIGANDGLGVENLRGSGQIAGETSAAYEDIFTLTYVTCRSVGIGAYLARLGQRVIQKADPAQPLLLTGYQALNKLLGRAVYTSNVQLGGPDIMYTNGVTHMTVGNDLEGCIAIVRWLSYVPRTRGAAPPILGRALDPVGRRVTFAPASKTALYDPRCLLIGSAASAAASKAATAALDAAASAASAAAAAASGSLDSNDFTTGLFDAGSFMEVLGGWARGVVAGRARLGGIPVGVVAVDPRTVEYTVPADPAGGDDSKEVVLSKAGQVWFPDSAYKTAQAVRDMAAEDVPVVVLANWRGFSGGMQDMLNEILKFGSFIVDALRGLSQPVIVYLPPHAMLRGGAWVVVDETINRDWMEMFADPTARGGVLEPEGTVDVKFRTDQINAEMRRCDPRLAALAKEASVAAAAGDAAGAAAARAAIRAREQQLYPLYLQLATTFADLHDTPARMHAKGCVRAVVPWERSRGRFYWRLRARLAEAPVVKRILAADAVASQVTAALAAAAAAAAAATGAAAGAVGAGSIVTTDGPSPVQAARTELKAFLAATDAAVATAAAGETAEEDDAAAAAADKAYALILESPAAQARIEAWLAQKRSAAALAAVKALAAAGALVGEDAAAAVAVLGQQRA